MNGMSFYGQLELFGGVTCQLCFEEHRVSRIDVEYDAYLWCFSVFANLMQGGCVRFSPADMHIM